jgi:hypothetical protein
MRFHVLPLSFGALPQFGNYIPPVRRGQDLIRKPGMKESMKKPFLVSSSPGAGMGSGSELATIFE